MSRLHPAIKVQQDSTIEGRGLVAETLIPAGSVLFRYEDSKPPVHLHEIITWPPQKRIRFLAFAIQIGEDDYAFGQGDIKFINHSCDPSGWWSSYGTLTAIRDIAPGQEITYDYSTSDITLGYHMECLCGSASCRGIFSNKDYLDPEYRKTHADRFAAHVQEAIRRADSGEPDYRESLIRSAPDTARATVAQTREKTLNFRIKYGDQYLFEMVREAVQGLKAADPELCSRLGDKGVFEMVRALVLAR
ncbi:MAG TPA: SET domain-containing protein-lysine N-methyltransferase [Gammaproteobacteria bacterium]|nr:SET domain-containing protein-lysine N-methyltransferase [Gammaproteobacteria bacterium]